MATELSRIRNLGIAAHIDAGKTTTTERFLYYTGRTYRMGEVDDGTTTTDFDEQEQKRGITIYSAAVSCPWKGYTINLIDTPGHVDFTAEVERSLRVLDGMVAVFDAREGVEAQSETVWRQADRYRIPRLAFINKMDRLGADFERSVESIQARLNGHPLLLQLPIGSADEFRGVIDLVERKAIFYHVDEMGSRFDVVEIPADLRGKADDARRILIERVAESSDGLTEKYITGGTLEDSDIRRGIREATLKRLATPVLCGSALRYIGVQPLLDAVCDYLPSPLDVPPVDAADAKKSGVTHKLTSDSAGPLVCLVFKIVSEKPVDLYYLRVYSGTLKANMRLLNTATGEKENVSRIYRMFAKRRDQITEAFAGDIVAVIGPRNSLTGHTLCEQRLPVLLEAIRFPQTVISASIEPKSSKDRDKFEEALRAIVRQDPTITVTTNVETGQTLLNGMGELHVEVVVHRIRTDMNVEVNVGKPRVSYRETVTVSAEAEGEFDRQIGGRRHFAAVRLRMEPRARGDGTVTGTFRSEVSTEALSTEWSQAIERGVKDCAGSGVLGGYPVIDWVTTLVDVRQHETDSSDLAFEAAGRSAFYAAMRAAGPALLEPIMDVEVVTPEDYLGAIMTDLNARRAEVRDTSMRHDSRIISAFVPLSQMFGYVTRLRSVSQGRAAASMQPSHFAPVSAAEMKALVG